MALLSGRSRFTGTRRLRRCLRQDSRQIHSQGIREFRSETAKANGSNREACPNHLLSVLPDRYFRKTPGIQFVDGLMPRSEKTREMSAKY